MMMIRTMIPGRTIVVAIGGRVARALSGIEFSSGHFQSGVDTLHIYPPASFANPHGG
jgi:hypothetical protein